MATIDRTRALAAFKDYTDAYDATNPRIALKVEHTYHVAEACDAVAREQGWQTADIDLAWLCGLLHDMGRFEQLRRWDTFKDAESMSHAIGRRGPLWRESCRRPRHDRYSQLYRDR